MRPEIYNVEDIGSGFIAIMAKPVSGEYIEDEFTAIAREKNKSNCISIGAGGRVFRWIEA